MTQVGENPDDNYPEIPEQTATALCPEPASGPLQTSVKPGFVSGKTVPDEELDEIEHLEIRTQVLNRAYIELVLMVAAIIGPVVILFFSSTGKKRMMLHPAASIVSSLLILLIVSVSASHIFREIRLFKLRYAGEAILAVVIGCSLAWLYTQVIDFSGYSEHKIDFTSMADHWGWQGLILSVGLFPGIFEEIAFRGVLQSRFDLIFGRKKSVFYTGIAFALCHSVSLAFPIHVLLGVYLCSLRHRSRSLIPGMLVHTLYNSLVIFF